MRTKKDKTITVAHYARRERRIIEFKDDADRSAFFSFSHDVQERIRDLHHAFVFIASCDSELDGVFGVCYGRRDWHPRDISRLYEQWKAAREDWRILTRWKPTRLTRPSPQIRRFTTMGLRLPSRRDTPPRP